MKMDFEILRERERGKLKCWGGRVLVFVFFFFLIFVVFNVFGGGGECF